MLLLKELPFSDCLDQDKLSEFEVHELFRDGHLSFKEPLDGIVGFFSVCFASANAKEMARYLELVFGFEEVAYRGLETGSFCVASHVLRNANVIFEVVNTLKVQDGAEEKFRLMYDDAEEKFRLNGVRAGGLEDLRRNAEAVAFEAAKASLIHRFVTRHGQGVMDITFQVQNVDAAFYRAVANGAIVCRYPVILQDSYGKVKTAVVGVPKTDLLHTLVEILDYNGPFLPHFEYPICDKVPRFLPQVHLDSVDHCVQNFTWNQMMDFATFYAKAFGLHKFWSVDEQDVSTGNTALKSIVMASSNGKVRMPINEPAKGKMKGQIEEFYDFYGGPGVQHVALRTRYILDTVSALRARGLEFNTISDTYYETLQKRLHDENIALYEDFNDLRKNHILVDFDPSTKFRKGESYSCNYILQIFSKPLHDRPTLFIEIIQRHHHNGFGKATFKGLFETIEIQQKLRGTLVPATP